jgi:hypothetical protein
MKTFLKAVVFAVPGIIAIVLVVWGIYLIATPLLFGQPVEMLATLGRHLTSLQAGLAVFVLGLVIAFRPRSPRSRGSPGAE